MLLPSLKPVVFISSTISDLHAEREVAQKVLLEIPAIPKLSEKTFLAQNVNSLDACINEVRNSDIYVLIIGGRYGYELEDGRSITEIEWLTAKSNNLPMLVFNLAYCEKEQKVEEFMNRVGEIKDGRFWSNVYNFLELESKIKLALLQLISDQKMQRKNSFEEVHTNLLEVGFPKILFLGQVNYNSSEIKKLAKDNGLYVSFKSGAREIAQVALKLQNLSFSSDWVIHNMQIISFHDLSFDELPLSRIIDKGTIESIASEEFYSIDEDHKRVFSHLLQKCLQQKLYRFGITWQNIAKLFIFCPLSDEKDEVKRKWMNQKETSRIVFKRTWNKNHPEKVLSCKHLAFRTHFHQLPDEKWYVSVIPDWFFSSDGYHESYYSGQNLMRMKKLERNASVFNHCRFIFFQLIHSGDTNLFNKSYPFIEFKDPLKLKAFPILRDDDWLSDETATEKNLMNSDDSVHWELFDAI